MTLFIRSAIVMTFICLLVSCGGGTSSNNNSNITLLTVGDSIGTDQFCGARSWTSRIASEGFNIINDSVSGRSTRDVNLQSLSLLIKENQPSYVLVLLGTNDSFLRAERAAIENMSLIANVITESGAIPVIGTVPFLPISSESNAVGERISAGYRTISGVTIADVRTAVGSDASLFCDGVHPTGAGQQMIASSFLSSI